MNYAVDLDELDQLIAEITAFAERLDARLNEADQKVQTMHRFWSGAAAQDHAAAHQRWLAGMRQMHEALTKMRADAQIAHLNYSSAVAANTTMWARL